MDKAKVSLRSARSAARGKSSVEHVDVVPRVALDDLAAVISASPEQLDAFDRSLGAAHAAAGLQLEARVPGARADLHAAAQTASALTVAAEGVTGSGGQLPHAERIQQAFGRHAIDDIRAHVGGRAKVAADQLGANGYATGSSVAFAAEPDLHLAAHEAAHIVQQRAGVNLSGGVGKVGDRYERHADEVADAVVRGQSAEPILDRMSGSASTSRAAVAVQLDDLEAREPPGTRSPTPVQTDGPRVFRLEAIEGAGPWEARTATELSQPILFGMLRLAEDRRDVAAGPTVEEAREWEGWARGYIPELQRAGALQLDPTMVQAVTNRFVSWRRIRTNLGQSRHVPPAQAPPDEALQNARNNLSLALRAARATVQVMNFALRLVGFEISGAAIGMRQSASGQAGVAGGAVGLDQMFMFDIATGEVSQDAFPFAEAGLGISAGVAQGVVIAFRVGPSGQAGSGGSMSDSYSGHAWNVGLRALLGVGLFISPAVLQGQEGWVGVYFNVGEQAGFSFTRSYAVAASALVEPMRATLSGVAQNMRTMNVIARAGQQMREEIASAMFSIFIPDRWRFDGIPEADAATIRRFGTQMTQVISHRPSPAPGQPGGLDLFLSEEGRTPAPSVTQRLMQAGQADVGLMIEVGNALDRAYRRQAGAGAAPLFLPNWFNNHGWLDFLRLLSEHHLMTP